MKNKRFLRSMLRVAAVTAAIFLLTACGEKTDDVPASNESSSVEVSAAPTEAPAPVWEGKLDKLVGEWDEVCSNGKYTDDEGTDEYYNFTDSDEYSYNRASIYKEDGKLRVDLVENLYEGSASYGMTLEPAEGAIYSECANKEWGASIRYGRQNKEGVHKVALISDNILEIYHYNTYESEDYSATSEYVTTYLRVGSPEYESRESYRYKDNVTVSTVDELLAAIGDDTRITLKEGVYNISDAGFNGYSLSYVYNLCIEAEEGKTVELCVNDGFVDVLAFFNCNNIVLRGLTLGHRVEKGQCDADVIHMTDSYNISIENCSLYGSGAYGISADDCSSVVVRDCDIYECTYGLMSLYGCSYFDFFDTTLRDTEGYGLVILNDIYGINFNGCTFSGNVCEGDSCLIENEADDDVYMYNCTFRDNEYMYFSNFKVDYNDCHFE